MSPVKKTVSAFEKFLAIIGIKLLIIVLASVLLCVSKITQDTWVLAVLTIAGFRTFNQAVGIVKGAKVNAKEFNDGNN